MYIFKMRLHSANGLIGKNQITPNSRRRLMKSKLFCITHSINGTAPNRFLALGSAPRFSNTRAISMVAAEP